MLIELALNDPQLYSRRYICGLIILNHLVNPDPRWLIKVLRGTVLDQKSRF